MNSITICQLCGAHIPEGKTCIDLFYELSLYTLRHDSGQALQSDSGQAISHPDHPSTRSGQEEYFIHQHVVDCYAAQHLNSQSKPLHFAAPLMGLYLFCEKGYTGKEVQKAHMKAGNKMKTWPILKLPTEKVAINVETVLNSGAASPASAKGSDEAKDNAIKEWVRALWKNWEHEKPHIAELVRENLR